MSRMLSTCRRLRPPVSPARSMGARAASALSAGTTHLLSSRTAAPGLATGPTTARRPFSSLVPSSAPDKAPFDASSGGETAAAPILDASDAGLERLLSSDCLAVQREVELANVLIGYEQANRYSIRDRAGVVIGFVCEDSGGLGASILRNVANTHRTFKADVLDANGRLLFRITKPFHLIQSELVVETATGARIGEIKMDWHLLKRRYDLFLNHRQFGRVDGQFLAWEFVVQNGQQQTLAYVDRNWMGLARELIADAGRYCVYFGSGPQTTVARFDASVAPPPALFSMQHSTPFPQDGPVGAAAAAAATPSLPSNASAASSSAGASPSAPPASLNASASSSAESEVPWYARGANSAPTEWWKNSDRKSAATGKDASPPPPSLSQLQTLPVEQGGPQPAEPQPEFVFDGRELSLDERAIVLGMAVLIDFDYFSHKSGSGGFMPFMPLGMGMGSPVPPAADVAGGSGGGPPIADAPVGDVGGGQGGFDDSTTRRGASDEVGSGLNEGSAIENDPEMMEDKWGRGSDSDGDKYGENGGESGGDGDSGGDSEGGSGLGGLFGAISDFFGGGD